MNQNNLCLFTGNLAADPVIETRSGAKGDFKVCRFRIIVNNERFDTASGVNCEAWDGRAEFIAKWFKKGSGIRLVCEMKEDSWTDKESGQKRYKTVFTVDQADFPAKVGGRKDGGQGQGGDGEEEAPAERPARKAPPKGKPNQSRRPPVEDDDEDENIPF